MKEIKAFIRPNKVSDIVHHLKDCLIYVSDVNQIYRVKDGLKNGN